MLNKKIAVVVLSSAFSAPAVAADAGWYGLGSIGQTDFKIKDKAGIFLQNSTNGASISEDKTDTGWKLGAGYMFNRNFGAEAGFVDLGKAKLTLTRPGVTGSISTDFKTSGIFGAGIGAWPISNQFSAFGKVGLLVAVTESNISGTLGTTTFSGTGQKGTTTVFFGAGVQYDVSREWSVRAEYEMFPGLGDSAGGEIGSKADITMLSIGAVFRFK